MPSTTTTLLTGMTTSVAVKAPCRVATTGNVTLSGAQTIDGVSVVAGDRVLVKDQSTGSDNGIWVAQSAAWTRPGDWDGSLDVVSGTMVLVNEGTTNGASIWRVSTSGTITIGTTSVAFAAATGVSTSIGFTQAGTGAVPTTAQVKMREWVSPHDFGAVGDANAAGSSGTNDAAAFALLEAAHTGKIVNLDGKIYLVNSPIPTKNNYINGQFVVSSATTDDQPTNLGIGVGALFASVYNPRQHSSSTLTWASANYLTALGYETLTANTSGRRNTALGSYNSVKNTTGYYNTAVGAWALSENIIGFQNTCVGTQALQNCLGDRNTAVGSGAGSGITTGDDNVAIGDSSGGGNSSRSICIGTQAGQASTGSDTVVIGYQALSNPTAPTGNFTVAIGSAAGGSLSSGASNVLLGYQAGNSLTTTANNTALGTQALLSATSGTITVAVGYQSLSGGVTGDYNVGVGGSAGASITSGAGNVAVGYQSGLDVTTGSNNTCVGRASAAGGAAFTNTTSVGYQATCAGSNQVTLGNASVATFRCQVALTVLSDERYKVRLGEVPGVEFIKGVDTFHARWNKRKVRSTQGPFASLGALNLKALQEKHDIDLGLVDETEPGRLAATYERLIPVLVKAIQELSQRIEDLEQAA